MPVPPPAFLDECVDLELLQTLRERGYVVESAQLTGLRATGDEVVLEYAARRGWVLVSHNEHHFRREHRRWLERGDAHHGIVCLPQLGPIERLTARVAMLLTWVGLQDDSSRFFLWGHLQQQLERGFRLPGFDEEDVRLALGRD